MGDMSANPCLLSSFPKPHHRTRIPPVQHAPTGNVLFQNSSVQGMLARMMSVLGPFPESLLLFGKETNKFFTSRCACVCVCG